MTSRVVICERSSFIREACEIVWKKVYPDAVFCYGYRDESPDLRIKEADELIFLGFTYPNEIMKELATNSEGEARTIRVMSNHKTAVEDLEDVEYIGEVDVDKSPLLSSWESIHPDDPVPYWVSNIDANIAQMRMSTEVSDSIKYFWYIMRRMINPIARYEMLAVDEDAVIRRYAVIKRMQAMLSEYMYQTMKKCLLDGKLVGVIVENRSCTMSYYEFTQTVLDLNPDLSAIVLVRNLYNSTDDWCVEYRSRPETVFSDEFPDMQTAGYNVHISEDPSINYMHTSSISNPFDIFTEVENDLKLPEFDSAEFEELLSGINLHDDDQIFLDVIKRTINDRCHPRKYLYEGKVVGLFHDYVEPFGKEYAEHALNMDDDLTAVAVVNYSITDHKWNLTFYSREGESEFANLAVANFEAFELFDEE